MAGKLAGAALLSPWIITAGAGEGLIIANEENDVLRGAALDYWAQNFLGNADVGGAAADHWNCPLTVPDDWWADLPVDHILVTYGGNEILRDNISKFCAVLQARHAETTATEYPGELHVHMIMNRFLFINEECKSEQDFRTWLDARIQTPVAVETK